MKGRLAKSILISLVLIFATIPLFSQDITIDKKRLQEIIDTQVTQKISRAVDEAVAVAIKAEDKKYIDQLASKDKIIADKQLEIDTLSIQRDNLKIQKQNIEADFSLYKQNHGLKRDFTIGGISFGVGAIGSFIISLLAVH